MNDEIHDKVLLYPRGRASSVLGGYIKLIFLTMSCWLLMGCVTVPAPEGQLRNMPWPQRQQQLLHIQQWQVRGAIAIHNGQQAQSANLFLQQKKRQYRLQIFGPLGMGRIILEGDNKKVSLQANNGHIFTAHNAEMLLQQQLGWTLPVSNLYYWLRGLPAPHVAATLHFDSYQHLQFLQQQGWMIHYVLYSDVHGIDLPSKIVMQRG
ncbi:MAG: outer membrane lipoprotein LolB, partial [Gammaproteobacteria bacterium]|nr:outer membrane lipoprotein LolB [Gammaproteobacteria bacterium]